MSTPLARLIDAKTRYFGGTRAGGRLSGGIVAFTLVELLVAMTVFVLLIGMACAIIGQLMRTVSYATAKIDSFQSARGAFEAMTQNLSQATLGTYWDYDDLSKPKNYVRKSDLHFVCGPSQAGTGGTHGIFFQAPLSRSDSNVTTENLLNAVGYCVDVGSDINYLPKVQGLKPRERFRLMQCLQPTQALAVYQNAGSNWIPDVRAQAWPLAENIIALVIWPKSGSAIDPAGTGLTANYDYDSRSLVPIQRAQLPPMLQVTMVAIDEAAAQRTPASDLSKVLGGLFQDINHYSADLEALKKGLVGKHINYRVFNAVIPLRESQWSATP